jgi:MORN repeat
MVEASQDKYEGEFMHGKKCGMGKLMFYSSD